MLGGRTTLNSRPASVLYPGLRIGLQVLLPTSLLPTNGLTGKPVIAKVQGLPCILAMTLLPCIYRQLHELTQRMTQ